MGITLDRVRHALAGHPRWQGGLVRPLMNRIVRRKWLSFHRAAWLELTLRRTLGQPLSPTKWDRMTFSDKLAYRRLWSRNVYWELFSDKLAMRDHVTRVLGNGYLPELLLAGSYASQFTALTGPYVLKANHGSGQVIFVAEGERLSVEQERLADSWLRSDHQWRELEWGYCGARRLLLAEQFLTDSDGAAPPPDYKLFTFDGTVQLIQIDTARFGDHRRMLRRRDWKPIDATIKYAPPDNPDPIPPANLEKMLDLASRLGKGHDFIRIDLYDIRDRVLVGELSPYPTAGNARFHPGNLDVWLGTKWARLDEPDRSER